MRQGAQGWFTGMTLRDGMGREEGGGFRLGNTCTSVALAVSHIHHRYHLSKFHIYALIYCIGVFLSDLLHDLKI